MNYVAYRILSLVSQMHGDLFIICHAEFGLAYKADKVALHLVPHNTPFTLLRIHYITLEIAITEPDPRN